MKKLIPILFISLFIMAGCEKDYQSPIIGKWQYYEIVDGKITFDIPLTWSASFDTWSHFFIFRADYTGEYNFTIGKQHNFIYDFDYKIDKSTIIFIYSAIDPDTADYSLNGNELVMGKAKYLKQ